MNIIVQVEFELAHYDLTVQNVNYYTIGTHPTFIFMFIKITTKFIILITKDSFYNL